MNKKTITVFTLAMINMAAIGSVKNWPTIAEYGFASLFYYILAAIIFFIPAALVSAELATGWPKIGGVFIWVREAFGHRSGFLAIWLLWIENVIWYPTALTFIAASMAYIFNPALATNKTYLLLTSLAAFWIMTIANFKGMKISGKISSFGTIFGTFIPAAVIIGLGCLWYFSGSPLQIDLSFESLIPDFSSIQPLVILTGVLLSFCGVEMSAIHARDVEDPQRNYPRATLMTVILILGLSILGVLAIALVVPHNEISLTAGSMQAFVSFVDVYNLNFLIPIMAFLVVIGALASLSTWIVGPSRGLLAAAQDGDLPPYFRQVNKHGMPVRVLILQALIVTALSFMFLLMPTVNSAYWILLVMVAQVYLLMYVMMFAAAIKLQYKRPNVFRSYKIPGGKTGMWIVAGLGIISSLFTLIIGFFPGAEHSNGNPAFFVSFLSIGMILICAAPSIILLFRKPSWFKRLEHEKGHE